MQPKKQLKVQYIGIFEEIDSFYWPKMYFLKKGQKIRAWVEPPPHSGNARKKTFFSLRPSLTEPSISVHPPSVPIFPSPWYVLLLILCSSSQQQKDLPFPSFSSFSLFKYVFLLCRKYLFFRLQTFLSDFLFSTLSRFGVFYSRSIKIFGLRNDLLRDLFLDILF